MCPLNRGRFNSLLAVDTLYEQDFAETGSFYVFAVEFPQMTTTGGDTSGVMHN